MLTKVQNECTVTLVKLGTTLLIPSKNVFLFYYLKLLLFKHFIMWKEVGHHMLIHWENTAAFSAKSH